jgi:cyclohexanecarboxylate-CoA ligase
VTQRFVNAPARQHGARYRARGWWRDATFVDDLRAAAARTPDKPALIAARAFAKDERTLTYGELAREVDHIAAGLVALGVGREDIVALQLPTWWQFTATALACARIGAVVAPIPVDYRRREVEFILARTEAVVYLGPATWMRFSHRDLLRELAPGLPALRHRIFIELEDHGPGELDFAAWLAATPPLAAGELDRRAPAADDVFLVMYTSGTTGEPKGVVHAYNTLYAIVRAVSETAEITAADVAHSPSGMTGMIGFLYNFLVALHAGATAVFTDLGDPDRGLALIEHHQISFIYAIPNFVGSLIDAHRRKPRSLASLRVIVTGSAAVPPHLIGAARDVLGVRMQALWGMTEIGGATFTMPDDPPDWPAHSDGRPCAWMEVQIADPAADGSGRLRVRGANQCLGYFQRPDLYADVIDADGWFDTGDLVRDDGRGGIRIVGRIKDVIVRNGYKVPVLEVEAALAAHPRVAMVALVAEPDPQVGERVCAVIVARDQPLSLTDVRDHLRAAGMSAQYWPDRVHLVGEMPLTATGKIQKYVLQDQLRAAHS